MIRRARGILVRVGIDQAFGGWNAPVDPVTHEFVYVPIPDRANLTRNSPSRSDSAQVVQLSDAETDAEGLSTWTRSPSYRRSAGAGRSVFCDQRLGGQHERGDRGGVLERDANDLGRIDDTGRDEILVAIGSGVVSVARCPRGPC
jgi:hypothetical protein